ncbi:hypothetical protein [Pseudomonas fulva]|uniref:hypothetical protein n=1 Tax=Pseudomonas fulva TaxID=47880 RepID=UPI0011D026BB|nr:hypothetical protein [Pseudomonas fulva]
MGMIFYQLMIKPIDESYKMGYPLWVSRFAKKFHLIPMVLLALLIGAAMVFMSGINSTEAASWVQAVGSIASIWGAFAIAKYQRAKEEQLIRKATEEKQVAYSSVVDLALSCADEIEREAFKSDDPEYFSTAWETYHGSHLAAYIAALKLVPVHELATPAAVSKHLHVTSAVTVLHKEISDYLADRRAYHAHPKILYEHIKVLCKWARDKPSAR